MLERELPLEAPRSVTMSRLVLVRHGSYNEVSGLLNQDGDAQMQQTGRWIKSSCQEGEAILILSSTAPRALGSAEVLAKLLNAPIEQHEILWSDEGHRHNFQAAYELVQSVRTKADLVILVTHLDYANSFPKFVGERDLGAQFPYKPVGRGQGAIIDYRTKRIIYSAG